ncbi:MAG: exosortase H [Methanomicrobia archaeon]|nr:exosortase H [Methanomicrobia archaeon]
MSKQKKGKGQRSKERSKAGTGKKLEQGEKGHTITFSVKKDLVNPILERVRENRETLQYVALFLSFCIAFYLFYYFLAIRSSTALAHLNEITASILGTLFAVGGAHVVVDGAVVTINGFSLEIIDECTAVFSSIVYSACILAYPTTLKNKGLGVAFGVPLLYAINMVRLLVITLVGLSAPHLFEFVHVYLWQASFIIFVVVIFLLWLKLIVK